MMDEHYDIITYQRVAINYIYIDTNLFYRLIGKLLIGYLEVPKKRDEGNYIAQAATPPTLETQSSTKPQPTSTIDMPRPSKNIVSPSLLPPPAQEDEDDKNPWEEAD